MAITMDYRCTQCSYASALLDDAQAHANDTTHTLRIHGSLTPNKIIYDIVAIERAAERKMRDAAIMREARDRGLLPKVGVRPTRSDLGIISDEILRDVGRSK